MGRLAIWQRLRRHQFGPAAVETAMVAFAVAVVAGNGPVFRVEVLAATAHLVVQRLPAGDHTPAGLGAALPVVHVVLLERAAGAEDAGARQADRFLDFRRGGPVRLNPEPSFGAFGAPPR